ncbi:MAG: hypothetical protein LBI28_12590 [Treponema sp.]|nr:hypothetical protein [Treponema sp.]
MADNEKPGFSFSIFLIKLTSRAFWVWLITTAIVCFVLWEILKNETPPVYTWMSILLGIWGGTAVLFVGGNVLIDALAESVKKAEIKLQTTINANANTNISGAAVGNATSDGGKK